MRFQCFNSVYSSLGLAIQQFGKSSIHYFFMYAGGKNIKKLMKQITTGTKKTEGVTWFSELSDKGKIFIPQYMHVYNYFKRVCH